VFWVQVRILPGTIRGDAAGAIGGRHWDEVKEPYAERVLALIERYAPGLSGKILGRAALSPLDLERENPNLIGGDSLSGSHHLDQNFLLRPVFGWSRYKTSLLGRRVYLARCRRRCRLGLYARQDAGWRVCLGCRTGGMTVVPLRLP